MNRYERATVAIHSPETARRALRGILTDALRDYEGPHVPVTAREADDHLATHLVWHLTLAGEAAEEQGEGCPVCAAVEEVGS